MGSGNRSESGHEVQEAMRHAAERLGADLSRTARDAREAAEELGSALRRSGGAAAERARDTAVEATSTVRRSVANHPMAWLGGAAGLGALVGLLLSHRSR